MKVTRLGGRRCCKEKKSQNEWMDRRRKETKIREWGGASRKTKEKVGSVSPGSRSHTQR